jgi:hypothetical protein
MCLLSNSELNVWKYVWSETLLVNKHLESFTDLQQFGEWVISTYFNLSLDDVLFVIFLDLNVYSCRHMTDTVKYNMYLDVIIVRKLVTD